MFHLFKKKTASTEYPKKITENMLDVSRLPRHVAIIMDGNGRWAKRKNLPRHIGHRVGADTLKKIVTAADDLGIKVLTVYAFSTENWKRPEAEVSYIMKLMQDYLRKNLLELAEHNVRLQFIGDISCLAPELQKSFADAVQSMENNTGLLLNIAVNYGGRAELTRAVRTLAEQVEQGKVRAGDIDEARLAGELYTAPDNDVDLVIRPGNDFRISNFLLWQIAYAEFWYTPICWPDFTKDTLLEALYAYQGRERRFGGLK